MKSDIRRNRIISFIQAGGFGMDSQFTDEYQAVLLRAASIPTTNVPSESNKIEQNAIIEDAQQGGAGWPQAGIDLFAELELLYVTANDASDNVFGRINWVTPGTFDATEVGGSLTKVTDVGVFGTSTIYMTTGWKPLSNKVKIGASDLSMSAWVKDFVAGISGVETDANNRFRILSADYAVNSTRDTHTAFTTDGFYMINSDASSIYRWWNGVQKEVGSVVTGTLSDFILPITASNVAGVITGRTTKVGIYAIGKKLSLHEVPLYSVFDKYMNGDWPVTKTLTLDQTPTPVGVFDYPAFVDLTIFASGNMGRLYSEKQDHNAAFESYLSVNVSTDDAVTWGAKQRVIAAGYIKTITLSGVAGTGIGTINGFNYTATFNTSLTQTATDFISTHAALLLSRGITATSNGAVITLVGTDETADISISWDAAGGVNGTAEYYQEVIEGAWGVTATGRVIIFYTTNLVTNPNRRFFYFIYSDDECATWSASAEMTNDFNSGNGQIAGPGSAITLTNGDMLKAVYGTVEDRNAVPTVTRTVFIYKCLSANNGTVWTQIARITGDQITLSGTSGTANINIDGTNYLATFATNLTTTANNFVTTHGATLLGLGITVTAASGILTFTYTGDQKIITIANVSGTLFGQFTADFEEPCLVKLANDDVLITLRSDPSPGTFMSRSTNSGVTWSKTYFHSPSNGKNPIATNATSSVIMTYGRWPGNANTNASWALVSISTDNGVTWRWRLVDDVKHYYMYGGLVCKSNVFIAAWARETADDFLSPTKLILNKFSLI